MDPLYPKPIGRGMKWNPDDSSFGTAKPKKPRRWREKFREAEIGLALICVGPLAAANLAFGIEGDKDATDLPGKFTRGQDVAQESFATGVWGVRVA